jgi:hypothetical protein
MGGRERARWLRFGLGGSLTDGRGKRRLSAKIGSFRMPGD